MSKRSSSIVLLLSILAVASTSDECKRFKSFILLDNYKIDKTLSISFSFRFCPEDIKAAVFRPMVRNCVEMMLFWRGFLRSKKVKYILICTGVLCINMQLTVITAVSMVWYRESCDVKTMMMMMISFEVNERLGWYWWYSFKMWNRGWDDDDDDIIWGEREAGVGGGDHGRGNQGARNTHGDHQSFFYFFINHSFSLFVNDLTFLFDISKRCRRFLQTWSQRWEWGMRLTWQSNFDKNIITIFFIPLSYSRLVS